MTRLMISLAKSIKCFTVSDLHFGHKRVSAKSLTRRLYNVLLKTLDSSFDYLFITGDIFDGIIKMNTVDSDYINAFVLRCLKLCGKHGIKLRLLEGTNTHDYKQSSIFVTQNEELDNVCDLRYFDNITYVKEKDGLTYIAVPDNARADTLITEAEVRLLLVEHKTEKVDLMLTHGQYFHHVPQSIIERKRKDLHDSKFYSDRVNFMVQNGHIHPTSYKFKILTIGSFDRLTHGEEHPKGGYTTQMHPDGNWSMDFVENQEATLFTTFDATSTTIDTIIPEIVEFIGDNEKLMHEQLRVRYPKGMMFNEVVKNLKDRYPALTVTPDPVAMEDGITKDKEMSEAFKRIDYTPITRNTIEGLLGERLTELGYTDNQEALELLKEFL